MIVNADDLGISKQVNDATFGLMEEGRVTSATLLANGPAIEDAVRSVARFPHCSFGAHLNVIEFEPLSKLAAHFLTSRGGMSRKRLTESAWRPKSMQAVYEEFSAQIAKLIGSGVPVSHIDSHQHVHTLPWLFPVVKATQARFGIRKIRRSRNIFSSKDKITVSLQWKKALYNWALRELYASKTTDGFTDLDTLLELGPDGVRRFGCIEVMVHPGAGALEREVRMLRGDCLKSIKFETGLINYNQLGKASD